MKPYAIQFAILYVLFALTTCSLITMAATKQIKPANASANESFQANPLINDSRSASHPLNVTFIVTGSGIAATGKVIYMSSEARSRLVAAVLFIAVIAAVGFAAWHG